jgi:predicted Fe-S protein YdhL (DUF1289 family)
VIDWSKMKPREILEIAQSIPSIAEPWEHREYSNGQVTWERRLRNAVDGEHVPLMQISPYANTWLGWWDGRAASGNTAEEARQAADKILLSAGYVLDNDLPCNVEDGVTMYCRGCGRLKNEHQTYPNDPPRRK